MVSFSPKTFAWLSALLLLAQAASSQRVVSIPFQKREKTTNLVKRAGYFTAPLNNYLPLSEYFATVEVGTPAQQLELVIDTGSSDVWFFGTGACNVQSSGGACEGGSYDSSKSSTYKLIKADNFSIQYETANSGVIGNYITDNLSIGGITVTNLTMAVATQANETTTGIMGIGLDTDESQVEYTGKSYYNLPDELYLQGKIATKAYSLYLDDLAATSGTVIFGGYDTAKFTGDLIMLPLQNDSYTGIIDSFAVAWTSLAFTDVNGTYVFSDPSDFPSAAILDSGTTLTYLPQDLFEVLAYEFGAEYNNEVGAYIVSCDIGQNTGSLNYGFGGTGGPVISVPFAELAPPAYNLNGAVAESKGTEICIFGLQPNSAGDPILFGQTFLRSAYVMYDLQNLAAGLAPTVFGTSDSNIVEYKASGAQASITTDTSGPTVTISSVIDNPGNPYSLTSSVIATTSGYGGGVGGGTSLAVSTLAVEYTRSYPSVTPLTSEPASLTGLTVAAAAATAGSSGSTTAAGGTSASGTSTGSSSSSSSTSAKSAAEALSAPASSSVIFVTLGTALLALFGGMLLL